MPTDVKGFFDRKLLALAGAEITPGSLLVGATVIVLAIALAHLLDLWARRLLRAGGTPGGVVRRLENRPFLRDRRWAGRRLQHDGLPPGGAARRVCRRGRRHR